MTSIANEFQEDGVQQIVLLLWIQVIPLLENEMPDFAISATEAGDGI